MKRVEKDWGYEEWVVNNELYCFKKIYVNKGYQCSIHWHKEKDETFYINFGTILLELVGKTVSLVEGDTYRLPPNTIHRFTALQNTMIFEISTHHEDSDSYRVIKGGKCDNNN